MSNLKDKSQARLNFELGVQFFLSQSESADRDRWINLTLEASNEVCGNKEWIYFFCICPGIFFVIISRCIL